MMDPGDEDDAERCPERWLRIALAGWRYREGKCVCLYPAVQRPPMPDHDPGDEQPRMMISPTFLAILERSL